MLRVPDLILKFLYVLSIDHSEILQFLYGLAVEHVGFAHLLHDCG
jgi:hypothetical protein